MRRYKTFQMMDLIGEIGEPAVKEMLSDFSSPINPEIEFFLKNRAIEFSKKRTSVTHLVFDDSGLLTGFYTLTHKPLTVKNNILSSTATKMISRFAKYDELIDSYNLSAFLIAQIGKNYNLLLEKQMSGKSLMNAACETLLSVLHEIGGGVVFLECVNHEKLLNFYQNKENDFRICGAREDDDKTPLIQLLRFLK